MKFTVLAGNELNFNDYKWDIQSKNIYYMCLLINEKAPLFWKVNNFEIYIFHSNPAFCFLNKCIIFLYLIINWISLDSNLIRIIYIILSTYEYGSYFKCRVLTQLWTDDKYGDRQKYQEWTKEIVKNRQNKTTDCIKTGELKVEVH